jgi:hypothetical protein
VGHGSSAAGAGGLRRRGAPLAVSPAGGLGTTSSEQGGGQSDGSAADMFCVGVLSRATSMPCWLVPFKQFQDPETERRCVVLLAGETKTATPMCPCCKQGISASVGHDFYRSPASQSCAQVSHA